MPSPPGKRVQEQLDKLNKIIESKIPKDILAAIELSSFGVRWQGPGRTMYGEMLTEKQMAKADPREFHLDGGYLHAVITLLGKPTEFLDSKNSMVTSETDVPVIYFGEEAVTLKNVKGGMHRASRQTSPDGRIFIRISYRFKNNSSN